MTNTSIDEIVRIRPHGTIIIYDSIVCDGEKKYGMEDSKNITCYTHIHTDHICGLDNALGGLNSRVYSTEETKILASELFREDYEHIKDRTNYFGLQYNETRKEGDFEITFLKSHHMLGSAQLLVRSKKRNPGERSVLYSSDFILKGTKIAKDVDYLILDATHGEYSERQKFDDIVESKRKIIAKVKEIMATPKKQLNIHASRGTLQLVMSWIRQIIDEDEGIPFLADRIDINIANAYMNYGFPCGKIEDDEENFLRYRDQNHPYIRFISNKNETSCEIIEPVVPSIRVGSSTATTLENNSQMYIVNLKEHATIDEIKKYVKEISPVKIIVDNSSRTQNHKNAKSLKEILEKEGYSVYLSPEKHPYSIET